MRLHNDGRLEFREDPLWFNNYMRREGIEWELPSWTQSAAAGPLEVN